MAVDMFLKIGGVEGESSDPLHPGEIAVLSYGWGEVNGSGSEGKAAFQGLRVVSYLQKSSPSLFLACATGVHFDKATLSVRMAGTSVDLCKLTFSKAFVSSFEQDVSGGSEDPLTHIKLSFVKVDFWYRATSGETTEVVYELPSTGWHLPNW